MKIIKLSQGKETVVDDDFVLPYKSWHAKKHGKTFYARHCTNDRKNIYLHRLILPSDTLEVDHIDGNGLNNLRSNLRLVTRRQQMQNQHGVSKTAKYRGVYWNPTANKWQAYVHLNNETKYLGVFLSQEDALYAREFAEKILNI